MVQGKSKYSGEISGRRKLLVPIVSAGSLAILSLVATTSIDEAFGWVEPKSTTSIYYSDLEVGRSSVKRAKVKNSLEDRIPWLTDFYKVAANAVTAVEIYPLVKGVSGLFSEKEYEIVDRLLAEVLLDQLSPTAMVTLVRTTYPARNKLTNWTQAVEAVEKQLNLKGMDSAHLLRGLV